MGRANGLCVLRAKHISSGAGRALLIGGRRLGYLALETSLLLGTQDVPYVVRCPSDRGSVGRSHMCMVRRASGRVHCRVEAWVLREVVAPVSLMHGGRVPVHSRTSGGLRVQRILGMPVRPARCEGRWCGSVVKHPESLMTFWWRSSLGRISLELTLHLAAHHWVFARKPSWETA